MEEKSKRTDFLKQKRGKKKERAKKDEPVEKEERAEKAEKKERGIWITILMGALKGFGVIAGVISMAAVIMIATLFFVGRNSALETYQQPLSLRVFSAVENAGDVFGMTYVKDAEEQIDCYASRFFAGTEPDFADMGFVLAEIYECSPEMFEAICYTALDYTRTLEMIGGVDYETQACWAIELRYADGEDILMYGAVLPSQWFEFVSKCNGAVEQGVLATSGEPYEMDNTPILEAYPDQAQQMIEQRRLTLLNLFRRGLTLKEEAERYQGKSDAGSVWYYRQYAVTQADSTRREYKEFEKAMLQALGGGAAIGDNKVSGGTFFEAGAQTAITGRTQTLNAGSVMAGDEVMDTPCRFAYADENGVQLTDTLFFSADGKFYLRVPSQTPPDEEVRLVKAFRAACGER